MGNDHAIYQQLNDFSAASKVEGRQPKADGLTEGFNIGTQLCEVSLFVLPFPQLAFLLRQHAEPFLQPGAPRLSLLQRKDLGCKGIDQPVDLPFGLPTGGL
jgi:hypothetical protein